MISFAFRAARVVGKVQIIAQLCSTLRQFLLELFWNLIAPGALCSPIFESFSIRLLS